MGLFDALFGGKSKVASNSNDYEQYANDYRELISFIKFAQKVKPLAEVVYAMYVKYEAPNPSKGVTVGKLNASMSFHDFDEMEFARKEAVSNSKSRQLMISHYYKEISEKAGLAQSDWPYCIDEHDFEDVLCGTFPNSYFTYIPDESNDSYFSLEVCGGFDSRNGIQVYNTVSRLINSRFPELHISYNYSSSSSMVFSIRI